MFVEEASDEHDGSHPPIGRSRAAETHEDIQLQAASEGPRVRMFLTVDKSVARVEATLIVVVSLGQYNGCTV